MKLLLRKLAVKLLIFVKLKEQADLFVLWILRLYHLFREKFFFILILIKISNLLFWRKLVRVLLRCTLLIYSRMIGPLIIICFI